MTRIFPGECKRCGDYERVTTWNNYGVQTSLSGCKSKCAADANCIYVTHRELNGYCTSFKTCNSPIRCEDSQTAYGDTSWAKRRMYALTLV